MSDRRLGQVPTSKTGMLIRRPVAEVFEAFVDPAITTRFWFTRSSGRLRARRQAESGGGSLSRGDRGALKA